MYILCHVFSKVYAPLLCSRIITKASCCDCEINLPTATPRLFALTIKQIALSNSLFQTLLAAGSRPFAVGEDSQAARPSEGSPLEDILQEDNP